MQTLLAFVSEELLNATLPIDAAHIFEKWGNDQKIEVGLVAVRPGLRVLFQHCVVMTVGVAVVDELVMQWSQD